MRTIISDDSELREIAKELNPKLTGWINHYGRFCKSKPDQTQTIVNVRIARRREPGTINYTGACWQ
jgi:Group II intron, maturase-specific domain